VLDYIKFRVELMKIKRKFRRRSTKTAVVSFVSGFGNNLYQLAAAYEMERMGFRVKFDLSNVKNRELEILDIPQMSTFVKPRIIPLSRYFPSVIGKRGPLARFIVKRLLRLTLWTNLTGLGELPSQRDSNYLITGFWARLSVAEKLPPQIFFQRNLVQNKVAIHVRRGDMIGNVQNPLDSFFRLCALEIIRRNPSRILNFYVYTDDPEYCLTTLDLGVEFEVILNGTTISDFCGLVEAEYLVLSKSTFSWWAGFFSKGAVFAPTPFESSQAIPEDEILPIRWEKFPCH